MEAPDLEGGFATVGTNIRNSWRTEIRTVLVREEDDGGTGTAYLTHECRAETVDEEHIFSSHMYDFAAIRSWDGNYLVRHGSYNLGVGTGVPDAIHEKTDAIEIAITCPNVPVNVESFDSVLEACQSRTGKRLFMMVNYTYEGRNFQIYVPTRYLNFPNRSVQPDRYLQPISGFTLFHNGDRHAISYLAAYISDTSCHIEFIAREPLGFMETKAPTGRLSRMLKPFNPLLNRFFRTDEFHKVYTVKGKVVFFSY
ncbi:hypothetical protein [Magnetospira sp. QH-2]|uniref:hypothetical protein n=1 Tax=Magnetospira sp. (strain QH-2) TaxID=1288970 RepID=UPI0003E8136C|nr:hypothetical protein [Magnetospira sp. QH-2]CCQ75510.1 protein of unknown function [Magnetospira sp. QH-2]